MKYHNFLCSIAALTTNTQPADAANSTLIFTAASVPQSLTGNTTDMPPLETSLIPLTVPEQTGWSDSTTTMSQNAEQDTTPSAPLSTTTLDISTTTASASVQTPVPVSNGVDDPGASRGITKITLLALPICAALSLMMVGRFDGLVFLILLLLPTATPSSTQRHQTTATDMATTTVTTEILALVARPPTTTDATLNEKKLCYQNVNGLLFPTPCVTYDVMTTVHAPAQPGSPPGPVCWNNGADVPCHIVASGAKERKHISAPAISVILVGGVAFAVARRAMGPGAMAMGLAAAVYGDELPTIPESSALSTITEWVTVTVTGTSMPAADVTILAMPTPVITESAVLDEKEVVCYQTVNGLAYQTPCQTFNVWTTAQAAGQPGPVCQEGGTFLPCVDYGMGHSGAKNKPIVPSILALSAVVGGAVLVLGPRGLLILPFALVVMAMLGRAGAAALPEPTSTSRDMVASTGTIASPPTSTTSPPSLTVPDEKAPVCYHTVAGLLYPSQCPPDMPLPQPTLGPGQCMRSGLVYDCTETYMTSPAARRQRRTLSPLALLGIPLLFANEDVLPLGTVLTSWMVVIANIGDLGVAAQTTAGKQGQDTTSTTMPVSTYPNKVAGAMVLADTCPTMYGMQACPLPAPSEAVVRSAARRRTESPIAMRMLHAMTGLRWLPYFNLLLQFSARANSQAQSVPQERQLPGLTSVALPELAVNTSTAASVTATKTVFVQWTGAQFTPTVTQFIAVCTPYCASVNDNGQCQQVKGCKNVVTSGSRSYSELIIDTGLTVAVGLLVGLFACLA